MKNNLLRIKDFSMAFGENVLFTNFDYEFTPGIYAFSGPSGVGKSTLMRIIAGLETRYTGELVLNGTKIVGPSPNMHMVHQHYTSFPWLNVLKNTLMVYKGHKIRPTESDVEEAKAVLKRLGLEEHLGKLPSQISGGQDQRLSLASAFINKWSPVVLYDEPTSALDNDNDFLVAQMIKEHQEKFGTIEIIITHEEHVVNGLNAKVLEFTPEFRLKPPKQIPIVSMQEIIRKRAEEANKNEVASEEDVKSEKELAEQSSVAESKVEEVALESVVETMVEATVLESVAEPMVESSIPEMVQETSEHSSEQTTVSESAVEEQNDTTTDNKT